MADTKNHLPEEPQGAGETLPVSVCVSEIRSLVDLCRSDTARLLHIDRETLTLIENGGTVSFQTEAWIRSVRLTFIWLNDLVKGNATSLRNAVLAPVTDTRLSLFDAIASGDPAAIHQARHCLQRAVDENRVKHRIRRPSPTVTSRFGSDHQDTAEFLLTL